MKIQFLLSLSILVIVSCNKVEQTEKRLTGEWELIDYKIINFQGLTYDYPAIGTMNFDNFSSNSCNYTCNVSYEIQGGINVKNESGLMEIHDDGEYFRMIRNNQDGSLSILEDGRIIVLTTNDLKVEFSDEDGRHQFILEK